MKKLLITLAAFTLLAACKEVEETPVDNTPQKSAVEGQWNFVSLNQSNGSVVDGTSGGSQSDRDGGSGPGTAVRHDDGRHGDTQAP